jgi:hypothetical protein
MKKNEDLKRSLCIGALMGGMALLLLVVIMSVLPDFYKDCPIGAVIISMIISYLVVNLVSGQGI